jgi:hypothetical protein
METIFDREIEVPAGFENDSVYVYYLSENGVGGARPSAGATAMAAQLRPASGAMKAVGAAGGRFVSNVVVTRWKADQPLAAVVAENRRQVAESAPNLRLVQEGPATVAKGPAHQVEYSAQVQEPPLQLVQWQVTTVRDGYAYTFFCSCEAGRWSADKPRFQGFIGAWK